MADVNGQPLAVGDAVEIVQMDDPAYRWLVGERGVVAHIPDYDETGGTHESQVSVMLARPQAGVPGLSTHQAWIKKIVAAESSSEAAEAPVEAPAEPVEG